MGTLLNGIKDIFSTSKTTATHLPVCASDGTPQGRISVGDLASVLGDVPTNSLIKTHTPKAVTDFNTEVGEREKILRYNVSHAANTTNAPHTGMVSIAQLEVSNWSNYFYVQRYFQIDAAAQYERIGGGNPVSWGSWVKIQTIAV